MVQCPVCRSPLIAADALCPACLIRTVAEADQEPGIDWGVASDWRLCNALDSDAHGTIYLAERGHEGEVGALHLSEERVSMPGAAERLSVERRRVMALDRQAIVPMLDAGLTETGQLFVVFEHVRGRRLRDYLLARPRPADAVEHLLAAVAAALGHVHDAGLAHGAVSAAAVILTGSAAERRVNLLGMGLKHLRATAGFEEAPTPAVDAADLRALREWTRPFVSV